MIIISFKRLMIQTKKYDVKNCVIIVNKIFFIKNTTT